jgi:hypothetical protein
MTFDISNRFRSTDLQILEFTGVKERTPGFGSSQINIDDLIYPVWDFKSFDIKQLILQLKNFYLISGFEDRFAMIFKVIRELKNPVSEIIILRRCLVFSIHFMSAIDS